jgi:beta-lactam-binding protein with PASTA domain
MVKKLSLAAAVLAMVFGLLVSPCHAILYYYTVPDVRGMPKDQAESTLRAKEYDVAFVEVPAENHSLVGKVLKQEPFGFYGPFVEKKKRITVTLSVAGKGSFVPYTYLMTEAAAVDAVKKAGFVPKVEYYSEEITGMVGKVKQSAPAPYLNLAQGGTVTLKVGKPGYAMPNLVGQYSQGAKQTIDQISSIKSLSLKSSISQGKTTVVQQDDQKVYEQSPAPGTILTAGSEIKLSAYKYVAPVPLPPKPTPMTLMPALVGALEKEATAYLTKVGLKVSVNYVSAPLEKQGRVVGQSIRAGSRTAGPVTLTVGRK